MSVFGLRIAHLGFGIHLIHGCWGVCLHVLMGCASVVAVDLIRILSMCSLFIVNIYISLCPLELSWWVLSVSHASFGFYNIL